MSRLILLSLGLLFFSANASAHFLWVETDDTGMIGKEQAIKVHFGEYTYGVIEKVGNDAFSKVKDFTLWVVDPAGNKTPLTVTDKEDHYLAVYTPKENGVYTILLNNDQIDVLDYTQYEMGIFKPQYHGVAKFHVGSYAGPTVADNPAGITLKNLSNKVGADIQLQVLFQGKPLAENEVKVYVADLWTKTLQTDKAGMVSFDTPWKDTKYIVEITTNEMKPGTFRGEDYQFIWHSVTHAITP